MKLYNGYSPNGFRVSAFLTEKGIDLTTEKIDVLKGEAKSDSFLARNSLGQIPVLELEDGRTLCESIAICRYLETLHPTPALFGETPEDMAFIEMWNRRVELNLFNVAGAIGLHEIPYFAGQVDQLPDYAASQRTLFAARLAWLDRELDNGGGYIAGAAFSVADITAMACLFICDFMEIAIPNDCVQLNAWAQRMRQRPSWTQYFANAPVPG